MSLKYEPASEPLHIYVKWLFLIPVRHQGGVSHLPARVIHRLYLPPAHSQQETLSPPLHAPLLSLPPPPLSLPILSPPLLYSRNKACVLHSFLNIFK